MRESESSSLVAAILSIIHPDQFRAACNLMNTFGRDPQHAEEITKWDCVFSGVSVVSNRRCPSHRDSQSDPRWFDLMVTMGPYSDARMSLRSLGLQLRYGPGAMVACSGFLVPHEVGDADGERVCLAYWMRLNLMETYNPEDTPAWALYQHPFLDPSMRF